MSDLRYATVVTDRHAVRVTTWRDHGEWFAAVQVDGRDLAEESLGADDDTDDTDG